MTGPRERGQDNRRRHFVIRGVTTTESFQSPRAGRATVVPTRNRKTHGAKLRQQLNSISSQLAADEEGNILEFEGFADVSLAFESLPRERSGIELLNVRETDGIQFATVYVPAGKLEHFERLVTDYIQNKTGAGNRSLDHRRLLE